MELSEEGLQLILDYEVGGGKTYYDKFCKNPTVPDPRHTQSGVTIGIGWDCGQNTPAELENEWKEYLEEQEISSLGKVCGLKGMKAYRALKSLGRIEIGWEAALNQFLAYTVFRYWRTTCEAFPGVEEAPQSVREALLSLVFNRGRGMDGDRRVEMRAIRDLVASHSWSGIPAKIREMERLWPETKGLLARREAEAKFMEAGLRSEKEAFIA
ncbi:MAG: hypothetical protein ACP5SH_24700 [Syntrophobacteraceae bacterium]